MKFSIIMPVYNVEDYIESSILSVLNQTYSSFELLIGNDESPDNSQSIIDKYKAKDSRIKSYIKKNTGPGDTRNFLIEKAKGDYLVFLDSDDRLNENFLQNAYNILKEDNVDLLRVAFSYTKNGEVVQTSKNPIFKNKLGKEAFYILVDNGIIIDIPSGFIFNTKYWKKNKYKYSIGTFHEDFAILPVVLVKAKSVTSTNDCVFYYTIRSNSTMNNKNYAFIIRKTENTIEHYEKLKKIINETSIEAKYKDAFIYYIENATISKLKDLNKSDYKKYKKILKEKGIYHYNANSSIKYILKKTLLNVSTKLYLKLVIK